MTDVRMLSGLDAAFLYLETPEMPMHVGALSVYELPKGYKGRFLTRLRAHMAERIPLAPALRRRLWWMPLNLANPAWVDAQPDLNVHVVEVRLPPSARRGDGMAELEDAVARLHAQLLDRTRPLWKFHVLEGLAPSADGLRRVAVYSQLHHAAVDGQAAVALAQVILDTQPQGRAIELRPSRRARVDRLGVSDMLRSAIASEALQVAHIVRQLPATLGTVLDTAALVLGRGGWLQRGGGKSARSVSNLTLAPRTALNHSVGTSRAYATVSLPLDELKACGHRHEATLNDLVLLLCGSALRSHFLVRGDLPRKSLVAAVPISLREKGDTRADNQASMSLVSLGTHVASLRRRLAHVKSATAAMKSTMGSLRSILPTDYPSIGVPWIAEAAAALYGKARVADRIPLVANLVISNVPGPPCPLYLAGARMLNNHPTSIVVHGLGLNITVQSYDTHMDFGLMADAQAMPQVRELAQGIRDAWLELQALSSAAVSRATVRPRASAPAAKRRPS